MKLLVQTLKEEFEDIFNNNIKLNAIGDLSSLPDKVKEELESIIENTKNNTGMTLTLALSYGGKQEIFKAVKEISQKVKNDIISLDSFDDSVINDHLYTRNLPDVDLLIRTSGEKRISNFLLWKIAYAELYFTDVYWPDFTEKDFTEAIVEYQNRERRFGKTSKQL
jgi:undecaprenyl diphosphate synthase